jgi:hypothetical protein
MTTSSNTFQKSVTTFLMLNDISMRISVALLLFCFNSTLMAQGLKGDWLLKGIAQGDHYIPDSGKSFRYANMRSQTGYFLGNGLCLGTVQSYEYRLHGRNSISIQPFIRVAVFFKKWSPFLEVSAGWGQSVKKYNGYNETEQLTYRTFKPGIGWRIAKHTNLDVSLGVYKTNRHIAGSKIPKSTSVVMGEFSITNYLSKTDKLRDSFSVIDNYLKKGIRSFGIDGGEYITGTFLTRAEWSIMMNSRLRLRAGFNNYFRHPKNGLLNWSRFNVEVQPYLRVKGNAFFVPKFGLYTTSVSIQKKINPSDAFLANISPSLVYVGKRNILEIGVETLYLFGDKWEYFPKFSAHSKLAFHHFISQKLALKVESTNKIVGLDWGRDSYLFWEPTGSFHLQFGFQYFYQKQTKN